MTRRRKRTKQNAMLRQFQRAVEDAQKALESDDELMAAAARGEPFWRQGDAVEVVGLAGYLPDPQRDAEVAQWAKVWMDGK